MPTRTALRRSLVLPDQRTVAGVAGALTGRTASTTIPRPRRWYQAAGAFLLALAFVLVPSAAEADGVIRDARCSSAFGNLVSIGNTVRTNAGFSQQVAVRYCPETGVFFGQMNYYPVPGYTGSHVEACSMHVGLVDQYTGWHEERAFQCTAEARAATPAQWKSLFATTGWNLPVSHHGYHMTGYINIRTHKYYGTYRYASRAGFTR